MEGLEMKEVVAYAPGKLMLAGEISVLEPGNRCLVAALDRGVTVTLRHHDSWVLHAPDVGIVQLTLAGDLSSACNNDVLAVPLSALRVACTFLEEHGYPINPLFVSINSTISLITLPDGSVTKPGLGSSSATIVAVVKAVLEAAGFVYSHEQVFKLGAIAQYGGTPYVGSSFDIAAAALGTTLVYSRFDPVWLKNSVGLKPELAFIVEQVWPGLYIQPIKLNQRLNLAVGFTGKSVCSPDVIIQLEAFKQRSPGNYQVIMHELDSMVEALIIALQGCDQKKVFESCCQIKHLFVLLEEQSGIICMTKGLEELIKIASAYDVGAKQSGAGGGDCGIAFCFDHETATSIKDGWRGMGIIPLDIGLCVKR